MSDLDAHIRAGRRSTLSVLDEIELAHGDKAAQALAGGIVAGVRIYLLRKYGARKTYALFAGMADDVITPELPVDPAGKPA